MNLVFHFINARNAQVLQPGTEVFRAGDVGTCMYVLLEGTARIIVNGRLVEVAGPGSIVGEMALIDNQPRSATVVATAPCSVVGIARAEFDLLVREKPEFARHVMNVVANRLRRMNTTLTPRESRAKLDDTVPV